MDKSGMNVREKWQKNILDSFLLGFLIKFTQSQRNLVKVGQIRGKNGKKYFKLFF